MFPDQGNQGSSSRYSPLLQIDRLGGAPVNRGNQFPHHFVSWKFEKPHGAENMAILVPQPAQNSLRVIAYNILNDPQKVNMVGWDVAPGTWEVTEGVDTNGDDQPDMAIFTRTLAFERTGEITFTIPPRKNYIIQLELKEKGVPYWSRPDLGIGRDDVKVKDGKVQATVHSLGAVD